MITERFLRDVARHEMTIVRDDGLYRHVRFRNPSSIEMHFDLVTWPGYLAYTGDMGAYVFQRTRDMFDFFRRADHSYQIDLHYWAEKCEASDTRSSGGGIRRFSHDAFRRRVRAWVRDFAHDTISTLRVQHAIARAMGVKALRELRQAVKDDILDGDDNEVRAYDAVSGFTFPNAGAQDDNWRRYFGREFTFEFDDFWEVDCKEYTPRFQWCCHALAWGIHQYDQAKLASAHDTRTLDLFDGAAMKG
jgi:hypothetical protein